MIGFAQSDNAHKQRCTKETFAATQAYDQNWGTTPESRDVQALNEKMLRTSKRNQPLNSSTELIWGDRQFITNKRVFGENQINGIFGHFGFDADDQVKTLQNYRTAFKRNI